MSKTNMPIGLAMALAQDSNAIKKFGVLSKEEQDKIISKAKNATSKEQMQSIVRSLSSDVLSR